MRMKMDQVVFGKVYRDKVTGFEGVCTAKVKYMFDVDTVLLESVDKGNKPVVYWAPASRVELKEECA